MLTIIYDSNTRHLDYTDKEITENTRASYPIEFIPVQRQLYQVRRQASAEIIATGPKQAAGAMA